MRLCDELVKYGKKDVYPFHMPGHKRNPLFCGITCDPDGKMMSPVGIDITEIDGFDDLNDAGGILLGEQERAANIFGSDKSFFLINGSTVGILAGISAAVPMGGKVVVAGGCHRSVYNGLELRQARSVYIKQDKSFSNSWYYGAVTADAVEEALTINPDTCLVIITSPTYEGTVSDVRRIADICHSYNVPLMVDAAHGAHLKFVREAGACRKDGRAFDLPEDVLSAGADIAVNSLHKTLPSLTGTSLLHVNSPEKLVDINEVKRYLQVYQTSSPSYILMSGISSCLKFLEEGLADENGRFETASEWFTDYIERLERFYDRTAALEKIKVLSPNNRDPGKIVMIPPKEMTGQDLMGIMRSRYRLELEKAEPEYAIAMTSVCDTDEGFARLAKALEEIDDGLRGQR